MAQYKMELRRILKSVIFLFMTVGIVLFAYTQGVFPPDSAVTEPASNGYYGMKPSNDPSLIMPEAAESLFAQYSENRYITYPKGFYKVVRLKQADRLKMAEIVAELCINGESEISQDNNGTVNTGNCDIENYDIESYDIENYDNESHDIENYGIQITGENLQLNGDGSLRVIIPDKEDIADIKDFKFNTEITWERFKDLMAKADKLLGGGSDFSETWISHRFGLIPVTYEEALEDYKLVISHDRLTGAHARLFSDYMGVILGLLPVFPAVFLCLCDRRNISPMIYTRRVSSARFILARFFALATATMLPILLMCVVLTCIHAADYGLRNIDVFAYFKYAFFWLFPTAMAAISVGLFFTTLTNTPVAIAIQFIWWFTDMLGGKGTYLFFGAGHIQLIPRHNALGSVRTFVDYLPGLIQNRIMIALIAALLLVGTIYVFSVKRRGLFYVSIFKHGKIQSKV